MFAIKEELKKYIGLKHLSKLPDALKRYKCPICMAAGFTEKECPDCGNANNVLMCPLDHCHCHHDVTEGVHCCPICGAYVCPECGSHDVAVLTRVTGYIQDLAGFNAGKEQEVKDRHRVCIATGSPKDEVIPDRKL